MMRVLAAVFMVVVFVVVFMVVFMAAFAAAASAAAEAFTTAVGGGVVAGATGTRTLAAITRRPIPTPTPTEGLHREPRWPADHRNEFAVQRLLLSAGKS